MRLQSCIELRCSCLVGVPSPGEKEAPDPEYQAHSVGYMRQRVFKYDVKAFLEQFASESQKHEVIETQKTYVFSSSACFPFSC